MSSPSSSEEVTYDLAAKAVLWGFAVTALLGPAGLLAGAAAAVAVMCSHSNDGSESNASIYDGGPIDGEPWPLPAD